MAAFRDKNRAAWNRLSDGSGFARVANDDECAQPFEALDGRGWLPPDIHGWNVLCLAAGGGWQSILYASAGANVTVVDISPGMLKLDEREAARRKLSVRAIEASMDNLSMLEEATFDVVHHPVSTCYVPKVEPVFREVARVIKTGGIYISQHKTPTSLQVTHRNERNQYVIGREYYHEGPLPSCEDTSYREAGTAEFLHRWEELVGGVCRAGFVIEDLIEPYRADQSAPVGHYRHRGRFVAPYLRMKAVRKTREETESARPEIWTP